MAYRLRIDEDLPGSLRACAREQLAGAVAQLEGSGEKDPAKAVHQARKHLKKARALLRLARPALGRAAYRAENDALRDAARQLSATRDADVLVATVDALAKRAVGQLPKADFDALRAALVAEAQAGRAGDGAAPDAAAGSPASGDAPAAVAATAAAAAEELREALDRIDEWPLDGAGWDAALTAASRAYARGRDAREIAAAEPTVDSLHEWRKRVKDLWYHHRLLGRVWPEPMDATAEQAHVLSELLGDDHDLAVLRDRLLAGVELPPGTAADLEPLIALVDERRAELEREAQRLGARLYAETPKAFERRLGAWLHAAVADAQAAGPAGPAGPAGSAG